MDRICEAILKSQDIFLLLKLVSLSKLQETVGGGEALWGDSDSPHRLRNWINDDGWRDWSDDDDEWRQQKSPRAVLLSELYSVRFLASETGISKSEISNILARCYFSGLAKPSIESGRPIVNTRALSEFIASGLRYVFPATMGEMTRGIATGLTAPIFGGELRSATDHVPVWPDPKGNTSGLAVPPLFKTVPKAVRSDPDLYAMLALVDSVRIGLPRERNLAVSKLDERLRG